jgi:transcriptional regulator with XRE-family HTH domain
MNHKCIVTQLSIFVNPFLQKNKNILILMNQRCRMDVNGGDKMEIGEKIKKRRLELGWSQRELAYKMGYTNNSTLVKIEKGIVDVSQSRIVQFSEVLGVSIAWLMDWEEEQKKNDIQADIILRMRSDDDFMSAVESLYNLDKEQLQSITAMLHTLFK